jgi:dTDP-4-dehydrorhamnose 3,5-epimerase
MIFTETPIPGAVLVQLEPHRDDRGFFARAWCREEFAAHGLTAPFVQANLAQSHEAGTLRGLHYQTAPYEEAKLIRCLRGGIYDVVVDLRPDSPTYRQWHAERLTAARRNALYVPEGCAHGYQTLEDDTEVFYQVTAAYTPGVEQGIRYDDPAFGVEWPRAVTVLSDKDGAWPDFDSVQNASSPQPPTPNRAY